MLYFSSDVGGHAALVGGVEIDETVDLVVIWRGSDVVAMLPVVQIRLLAEAEACVKQGVLVLRVMRMLGRS